MGRLIKIELQKIFAKGRSYIGFIAIGLIIIILEVAIWIDGKQILSFITQNLEESFFFQGNLLNGYLITWIILNTLWIHVPLLVTIVTGDLIAGEANQGTFRVLLSRPVDRTKLLFAKYVAGLIYSSLLVIFLGILSYSLGIFFLGRGDLIIIASKINILPQGDLLWRFIAAFGYGILSMAVVTSLSFFFSTLSNNPLGPIIATLVVIITFSVITAFEIPVFNYLRTFLFTTYLNSWRLFFDFDINMHALLKSIMHLLINLVFFLVISIIIFRKKDILT